MRTWRWSARALNWGETRRTLTRSDPFSSLLDEPSQHGNQSAHLSLEQSCVVRIPPSLLVNIGLVSEVRNDRDLLEVGGLGGVEEGRFEHRDSIDVDLLGSGSES